MKKKFYSKRFDKKQFKRKTIKDFRKIAGLSKKRAYYEFKRRQQEDELDFNHCENVFNFFKDNDIKVINFEILTEFNHSSLLFNIQERKVVKDVNADLILSNMNNANCINFDNLKMVPLFAYCASIGRVYEPERAKTSADYLLMITFKAFIESLLYYKYETFNELKKEYKKLKERLKNYDKDFEFTQEKIEDAKQRILKETDAENKLKEVIELINKGE